MNEKEIADLTKIDGLPRCLQCGKVMRLNVPRLGPDGGYVHDETSSLLCGPAGPIHWQPAEVPVTLTQGVVTGLVPKTTEEQAVSYIDEVMSRAHNAASDLTPNLTPMHHALVIACAEVDSLRKLVVAKDEALRLERDEMAKVCATFNEPATSSDCVNRIDKALALTPADMAGKVPTEERLAEAEEEIKQLREQIVCCFYGDEVPIYIQGAGPDELCDVVTAVDLNHLAKLLVSRGEEIVKLRLQLASPNGNTD